MSAPPGIVPPPKRPTEPAVVRLSQPIYIFDIDLAGVVSNINYLKWSEIWRQELAKQLGMRLDGLMQAGLLPLVVRQELNFRRGMRYGESASLEGWVEGIGNSSFTLWLEMRDAATGELCCDNRQVLVMTDVKTRASVPIPAEMRRKLEAHM